MKMIAPIFILLITLSFSADAEVFKCKSSAGEIIYQPSPCTPSEILEGKLKTKEMSPEEIEKANALRKSEEQEEAAYDADKARAKKQRQIELEEQEMLQLERRRTKAQEEEANAARNRMWRPPQPIYNNDYR